MLTRITFALFLTLGLSLSIVAQENKELVGSYVFSFEWGETEIKLKPNGTFISSSSSSTSVTTWSGPYSVKSNVLSLTTTKMWVRSSSDNKDNDVTKRKARKKYLDTDEPFKPETWDLQIVRWGQRIYLMDQKRLERLLEQSIWVSNRVKSRAIEPTMVISICVQETKTNQSMVDQHCRGSFSTTSFRTGHRHDREV